MNKLRILALALILAVTGLVAVPLSTAGATTCTSQYIQPNTVVQRGDDEMGLTVNIRVYQTVYSYACGSRDRFTDFRIGYVGRCTRARAVVVNPSSIAGRNIGAIRLPCRASGGASAVFSLYNRTYAAGVGDRCASATGYLDLRGWPDQKFRLPLRCQR